MESGRLGDISITRISEKEPIGRAPPSFLLPDYDPEVFRQNLSWLAPNFYDPVSDRIVLSFHSWLLRTQHHNVLIDTCIGNHKNRPSFPPLHQQNNPWLENLQAAGVSPSDIDFVMCTHLHADHVGWNTRLDSGLWVPTFPNARYLFSKTECEHSDPRLHSASHGFEHDRCAFMDSVLPILESNQAQLVDGIEMIDDQFLIEPAPGHTPGHVTVRIKADGREGLFTGDIMHHPIQVYRPDWSSHACWDPEQASKTRIRILEESADRDVVFYPGHFGKPYTGRVVSSSSGFAFRFSES